MKSAISAFVATAAVFSVSSVSLASTTTPALAPKIAESIAKVASEMQSTHVRTSVREIINTDGTPCLPDGISYAVDLEVKMVSALDREKGEIIYRWETVKSINVDSDGIHQEVCGE